MCHLPALPARAASIGSWSGRCSLSAGWPEPTGGLVALIQLKAKCSNPQGDGERLAGLCARWAGTDRLALLLVCCSSSPSGRGGSQSGRFFRKCVSAPPFATVFLLGNRGANALRKPTQQVQGEGSFLIRKDTSTARAHRALNSRRGGDRNCGGPHTSPASRATPRPARALSR